MASMRDWISPHVLAKFENIVFQPDIDVPTVFREVAMGFGTFLNIDACSDIVTSTTRERQGGVRSRLNLGRNASGTTSTPLHQV